MSIGVKVASTVGGIAGLVAAEVGMYLTGTTPDSGYERLALDGLFYGIGSIIFDVMGELLRDYTSTYDDSLSLSDVVWMTCNGLPVFPWWIAYG